MKENIIGPLHDPVTWYKIKNTGEQVAQWDFQNKGRFIVLEVPLRNLLTSIFNFVPCDRVVQRAYYQNTRREKIISMRCVVESTTQGRQSTGLVWKLDIKLLEQQKTSLNRSPTRLKVIYKSESEIFLILLKATANVALANMTCSEQEKSCCFTLEALAWIFALGFSSEYSSSPPQFFKSMEVFRHKVLYQKRENHTTQWLKLRNDEKCEIRIRISTPW